MNASALAPLAVAAPLTVAGFIAAFGRVLPRRVTDALSIIVGMLSAVISLCLITIVAMHGTLVHWFGGWTPRNGVAIGIAFVVDPIGGALATFAAVLATAALVFAWTYYDEGGPELHVLMLVFAAALIGFFLTGDLFNMFVFFELMGVAAFALTAFRSEDDAAVMGGLSFAVINSIGAFLVLIGIVMVYARTGALNMAQLGHALAAPADPLVLTAFALICFGFLVKASIVPAHFWLTEAHAVAPTPLCVLFSGIMVQAGIYAVARLYVDVFSPSLGAHEPALRWLFIGFGLLTAFVGAFMCFCQRHLKRLLAFSTISHSGIMLCAFALFSARGLGGLTAYIIGHGLVKGTLFMCSGVILNRWKSLDVEVLRGKLHGYWWLTSLLTAGAFALSGLPLFGTFIGKAMIERAADEASLVWLGPLLLLAAAITGASVLRATGTLAFGWGPPRNERAAHSPAVEIPESSESGIPYVMLGTATFLLALCVAAAFVPERTALPLSAALRFLDRVGKVALVLHGVPIGPPPPANSQPLGSGTIAALIANAFAAALAGYALFRERLRGAAGQAGRLTEPIVHALRIVHTGIVTDHVIWLVVGIVVFGAGVVALAG